MKKGQQQQAEVIYHNASGGSEDHAVSKPWLLLQDIVSGGTLDISSEMPALLLIMSGRAGIFSGIKRTFSQRPYLPPLEGQYIGG